MKKVMYVLVFAAGYIFGARAGRKRYEQIADQASRLWSSAPVQNSVDTVVPAAKHAAAAATEKVKSFADVVAEDRAAAANLLHTHAEDLEAEAVRLSNRADAESAYGSDVIDKS
jgi:hypothetical protein